MRAAARKPTWGLEEAEGLRPLLQRVPLQMHSRLFMAPLHPEKGASAMHDARKPVSSVMRTALAVGHPKVVVVNLGGNRSNRL